VPVDSRRKFCQVSVKSAHARCLKAVGKVRPSQARRLIAPLAQRSWLLIQQLEYLSVLQLFEGPCKVRRGVYGKVELFTSDGMLEP